MFMFENYTKHESLFTNFTAKLKQTLTKVLGIFASEMIKKVLLVKKSTCRSRDHYNFSEMFLVAD